MFDRFRNIFRSRNFVRLETRVRSLEWELDALRSKLDLPDDARAAFAAARETAEYRAVWDDPEPLVSICVGTWNRAEVLTTRTLPSLLTQSWRRIEILVVGDACTDDTAERIAALGDDRIHFENLPRRGPYPDDPHRRWMVAGIPPVNRALELARGSFVTHLDDDDTHPPHRVERLVEFMRRTRADFVHHPFRWQDPKYRWQVNRSATFEKGQVTTSAVFYHRWFARMPWRMEAEQLMEPGDWNRFRKIKWLGARIERCPDVLLDHYRERSRDS